MIKNYFFIFFIIFCNDAFSQQTMSASGNSVVSSGISFEWNIGQIDYVSNTSSNGNWFSGILSPSPSKGSTLGILDSDISEIKIYPNPVSHFLIIKINQNFQELICQMFDEQGKLYLNSKLKNKETELNLEKLPNGIYYIKITKDNKIKIFKIIKK